MHKVQSLKATSDYRSPYTRGKFSTTSVQIDWEGPVLHYKSDLIFWKKLPFKDVLRWNIAFEPGGKPDKFGRLRILHIVKFQTRTGHWEFALPPEAFENWLYWIIRSMVKHSRYDDAIPTSAQIKSSILTEKHKTKATARTNLSAFDRSHDIFLRSVSILLDPVQREKLPTAITAEGGTEFGKVVKKIGKGGSDTVIMEILQKLKPVTTGAKDKPITVKIMNTAKAGTNPIKISLQETPQYKNVAVKVGKTNAEAGKDAIEEMIKEARVLAVLGKHPNIVGLIDAGLAENRLCLFMELGDCALNDRAKNTLSRSDVLKLAQDILNGIAHMHKNKTYHLDMKAENVIICRSKGETGKAGAETAKIIDFGKTRCSSLHSQKQLLTLDGESAWYVIGTKGYICPESWDSGGQANLKSNADLALRDSYAVGLTIINGLLAPFLKEAVAEPGLLEQKQHVLERIKYWENLFLKKVNFVNSLQKNGLLNLANVALGLTAANPAERLKVEEAAFRLKTGGISHSAGKLEITHL